MANGSSGNSKPVKVTPKHSIPVAPGMGMGGARSVKGPKIDPRQKPMSRGMGGVAGSPGKKPGMGRP